jgi:hypothetical protein
MKLMSYESRTQPVLLPASERRRNTFEGAGQMLRSDHLRGSPLKEKPMKKETNSGLIGYEIAVKSPAPRPRSVNCIHSRLRKPAPRNAGTCMTKRVYRFVGTLLFTVILSTSYAKADILSYTGTVVDFTVTETGTYFISAAGAQGGDDLGLSSGGLGAEISGYVSLAAGEQLAIVVGGAGKDGNVCSGICGGGGGGASFVYVVGDATPLVVAGGGGAGFGYGDGGNGLIGTSGGTNVDGGAGGTGGSGGAGNVLNYGGGGGAGWLGNGGDGIGGCGGTGGQSAPTFQGGTAESSCAPAAAGGFGGGGGGGYDGGGGGGGYSGGGGGYEYGGGGGGSYIDALFTGTSLTEGCNTGNGVVDISLDSSASVPEPSSVILLLTELLGVALVAFVARRRIARGFDQATRTND